MRALIAPDKFKGTLSAIQAAASIARGLAAASDAFESVEFPMADGGDGTLDVLRFHLANVRLHDRVVEGPLGEEVSASFGIESTNAWVEMAACSGLHLTMARRALAATSFGTGQMIHSAWKDGSTDRTVVAVGGSASTDGGTGAARAFGWRFLDAAGAELAPGGGALVDLARIERGEGPPAPVVGACDVDSPLTGESGAARVFAPQKGATPREVGVLDRGLMVLAERISDDLGISLATAPFGGAGGGMGAGLIAFFDAQLRYGFDLVAEKVDFARALDSCDLVITGEGAFDDQSSKGKVTQRVAQAALARGVPCYLIAGAILAEPGPGFAASVDLTATYGKERSRYEAQSAVAKAAMQVASEHL